MEPIPGLGEHKKLSEDKVGGSTVSGAVGAEVEVCGCVQGGRSVRFAS